MGDFGLAALRYCEPQATRSTNAQRHMDCFVAALLAMTFEAFFRKRATRFFSLGDGRPHVSPHFHAMPKASESVRF